MMHNSLYSILKRISTGKFVVILGILFIIATNLNVGKPFGMAQLEEITHGVGALDGMSYDVVKAYGVMDQQGEAGRQFYSKLLLTTELIFPLIYRVFNVVLIAYLFSRWLPLKSKLYFLCFAPLVGMLMDYCENTLVLVMLSNYPVRLDSIATAASTLTFLKWLSNYLDWTLIIIGLFGVLYQFAAKKLHARNQQTG